MKKILRYVTLLSLIILWAVMYQAYIEASVETNLRKEFFIVAPLEGNPDKEPLGEFDYKEIVGYEIIEFYSNRITAYTAHASQTDSNPMVASCGPNKPNMIAVSRDYFYRKGRKWLCGATAYIITDDGQVYGPFIVYDTMNSRYYKTVDIYMGKDIERAFEWGVKSGKVIISVERPVP